MRQTLAGSILLSTWVFAGVALAAGSENNGELKGDYGLTGTAVCNVEGGTVTLTTFSGTRTFHGDGTGSSRFVPRTITAAVIGASTDAEVVDSFTYTVNDDGSWSRAIDPGSWQGTLTTGPNTGKTFFVDQLPSSTGFVSRGAENLTEVTTDGVLETVTRSDGNVSQRVCQRSFVLIKLHS